MKLGVAGLGHETITFWPGINDLEDFKRDALHGADVIESGRGSLINEDPFIQFGYDPRAFDIIVTKSKTHFRAVYENVGEEIIIVDAPGQCPADTRTFDYRNVPPVVYPITRK